jgi:hypothetical protein
MSQIMCQRIHALTLLANWQNSKSSYPGSTTAHPIEVMLTEGAGVENLIALKYIVRTEPQRPISAPRPWQRPRTDEAQQ